MKYYVYISDSKVDMLLGQLPDRERQKLAVELKLDLKVLSVKVTGTGHVGPMDHRVSRLDAVIKHLRATDYVGDFASPGEYIADTIDCSYSTVNAGSVAFAIRQGTQYLLMTGSSRHLIGRVPNVEIVPPEDESTMNGLMMSIYNFVGSSAPSVGSSNPDLSAWKQMVGLVPSIVNDLHHKLPPQRVEFLAKRFLRTRTQRFGEPSTVVLASPIFVSLAS